MPFKPVTLATWDQIRKYDKHEWLFRGQQRAAEEWDLKTSLERCFQRHRVSRADWRKLEARLMREFRRVYHEYGQRIPDDEATVEWLSLMQHHGAPTRLLDFTYSIYIAAYFAVESAVGDCAVWAIDSRWASCQAAGLLRSAEKSEEAVQKLLMPLMGSKDEGDAVGLFFGEPPVCAACPINPFRLNQRLRIQRGAFMVPGDVSMSFMTNLEALEPSEAKETVLKIVIPQSMVSEAVQHLFSMGISRTSLFPGLDGFSQSLGIYHPVYSLLD